MKTTVLFMLAGALAVAACTHDGKDPATDPEPNPDALSVVDWANEMAIATEPDTIQDKFAIVVDTDDLHAFDGVIEIAKQQAAAEAAAGD
jgi:hypothetical protein